MTKCAAANRCGSCIYANVPYEEQLRLKQKRAEELLGPFAPVEPIAGMRDPLYYRNKVHHVFGYSKKIGIISGSYEAGSHIVVNVDDCLIEDRECLEVIKTVRKLAASFKLRTYDEDAGRGLLRHVVVRRGFSTGEIMVILVLASQILPGKNAFVAELRKAHPKIRTIVLNVNDRDTSAVLGPRYKTIYGPGQIRDVLLGNTFLISPSSFYQVNPVQTEVLYQTAVEFADLKGKERVIDAYCGIGTIGLTAAGRAGEVIGVELNGDAVKNAVENARANKIQNARFYRGDATEFMEELAAQGQKADVVFMDPPRSGSTERFINACAALSPSRVVYVSCDPETLARDLRYFAKKKYRAERIRPVDMFPFTEEIETVVLLVPSKERSHFSAV